MSGSLSTKTYQAASLKVLVVQVGAGFDLVHFQVVSETTTWPVSRFLALNKIAAGDAQWLLPKKRVRKKLWGNCGHFLLSIEEKKCWWVLTCNIQYLSGIVSKCAWFWCLFCLDPLVVHNHRWKKENRMLIEYSGFLAHTLDSNIFAFRSDGIRRRPIIPCASQRRARPPVVSNLKKVDLVVYCEGHCVCARYSPGCV